MFESSTTLMLALMSISTLTALVALAHITKEKNPAEKAAKALQFSIGSLAVMLLLLRFSLPDTSSLSTFGYPESVEEIQSTNCSSNTYKTTTKHWCKPSVFCIGFYLSLSCGFSTTLFLFVRASSAQSNNTGNSAD
jgi:hypothetical protein